MVLVCTTCSAENPADTTFCGECGIELTPEATTLPSMEDLLEPLDEPSLPEPLTDDGVEPDPDKDVASPWAAGMQNGPSDRSMATEPDGPPGTRDLDAGPPPITASDTATAPAVQSASLVLVEYGQVTDRVIPLHASPVIVGKFDPSQGPVDIDLGHFPGNEYLSRRHAELYFNDQWMVRDLGSTNGVFIRKSGQANFQPRLQGPAPLEAEDEVAFGNLRFIFRPTG